jgi:uncharacterized membrane protein
MEDRRLIDLQKELEKLVTEYKDIVREYQSSDFIRENSRLEKELSSLRQTYQETDKKYEQLLKENADLKAALREQIIDEKLNIIKVSRQKLHTYFAVKGVAADNSLTRVENKFRERLNRLHQQVQKTPFHDKEEFLRQIVSLSEQLQKRIQERRKELERERLAFYGSATEALETLANETVSEKQMQSRMKQNEIEVKIGLNWFNRIGILLILFGVGAAFRYSYALWFTDHMKGIVFYLLGIFILSGGEWFHRKGKQSFATGLISGGIAILYSSTFFSYFLLHIIGQYTAVLFTLLISLTAVLLSLRYQSRTICTLGLVGGYFPLYSYMLSYGFFDISYLGAMAYLLVLNLSVLLLSFRQRWNVLNYFSFFLHLPSYMVLAWANPQYGQSIAYAFLFFLLYLTVTLAYPLLHKLALWKADVALLALNTVFSCLAIYLLLEAAGWQLYHGLLALVFSLSYLFLARFTQKATDEQVTVTLFYVTSLTFAVLMIPFQFGVQWISLGWLVEGTLLIVFGYMHDIRRMERAGWIVFGLCLAAFMVFDFNYVLTPYSAVNHFHVKYFFVTLGLLLTLTVYIAQKKNTSGILGDYLTPYKYLVLVNLWFYLIYSVNSFYNHIIPFHNLYHFYQVILLSAITFITGYIYKKIPLLDDTGVRVFSSILFVLGCLAVFYANWSVPVLSTGPEHTVAEISALIILIQYNLLVLVVVREAALSTIRLRYMSLELYPLLVSIWLLTNTTAFLTVQFRLSTVNLTISVVYLLLAAAFTYYGLVKRFIYIRRFGLGLALFATAKLFLYDLSYLSPLSKIFAYFSFGLVLIAISYIYQRLERGWEETHHAKDL